MKQKKVLFVATEFASGMIPFAATVVNTLAEDARYKVYCLCVCSGRYTYRNLISPKASPVYVDYPTSKLLKLLYKFWPFSIIRMLREMERALHPDAVHFLTGDFTMANYLGTHFSSRICYTVHDMYPHDVKLTTTTERFIFRLVNNGYRRLRETVANLTTSSYAQINELRALYPNKNVTFTPFPTLVTDDIKMGGIEVSELKGVNRYILFFGSVQEYKGVQLLIDAFNESKVKEETKLVIAGRGMRLENLTSQIIRINRFIDDRELKVLFEGASFVVYPYLSATMSGVLSIAYYFRKLVLLSNIPFFKQNATAACVFFNVGDKCDLIEKLDRLILYNGFNIVKEDGYDRIYSDKALAEAYYEFYDKIEK